MNFEIRQASISDINHVTELWKKLAIDQLTQDNFFTGDIDFTDCNEQVSDSLTNSNCCIFIAYTSTSIIGFIEVWLQNKDFYFFEDDYAYIMHMFIDPQYRSYQIMKSLYNKAEEWTISKKRNYLIADAFQFNQKALKILNFLGLKPYKTRCVKELKK